MKIGILAAALLVVGCGKHHPLATAQQGASTDATAATIQVIDGDGSVDGDDGHVSHHLDRAVVVRGAGLEGAGVTLEQGGALVPLVTKKVEGGLEAFLPPDVKPGSARLHVKTETTEMVQDLALLQGEKGADGADGKNGLDGAPGLAGTAGPMGPSGTAGPMGPQGPSGVEGPSGPRGLTGLQGDRGPEGPQGVQGARGDAGPKGDGGEKGPKGDTGDDGILGTDIVAPSGNLVTPSGDYSVIGEEKTVSLADDAYLSIVADVRASSADQIQPRNLRIGIRIAGENQTDASAVRALRANPAHDRQSLAWGRILHSWTDTEARMTFLFKTSNKVKSGNVKVGLIVRCAENDTTTCDKITFNPTEQHILVTQLR